MNAQECLTKMREIATRIEASLDPNTKKMLSRTDVADLLVLFRSLDSKLVAEEEMPSDWGGTSGSGAPCHCGSTDICCGDDEVGRCVSHCTHNHVRTNNQTNYFPEG